MSLSNTLSYWSDVSLLSSKVSHCLMSKHCKYDDSIIVSLVVFSSDAVHMLGIPLHNLQATSTAGASGWASK